MAEAIVNAAGARHLKAFSAGFEPAKVADPHAMEIIAQAGIRARGLRPKPLTEFAGPPPVKFCYAINLATRSRPELAGLAGETCLLHWPVADRSFGAGFGASRKAELLDLFAEIRQLCESMFLRPARTSAQKQTIHRVLDRSESRRSELTVEEHC